MLIASVLNLIFVTYLFLIMFFIWIYAFMH
jgi:hypothetical protein